MLEVTGHSTAEPGTLSGESALTDIVTDVVKIRIPSSEAAGRVIRPFAEIRECTAELLISQIFKEQDAWVVRLTFRVSVFIDEVVLHRLVFFRKRIPFPLGCFDCRKFTPRVEVSDVSCTTIPLLDAVEVVVHFHLVVKGLLREEITVLTPEPGA